MGSSGHPDGGVAASNPLGGVGGILVILSSLDRDTPVQALSILILTVVSASRVPNTKKISEFPQRSKKTTICIIFFDSGNGQQYV